MRTKKDLVYAIVAGRALALDLYIPLLLLHGDQDPQMPINQAHELNGAYQSIGLNVQFHVVHGAAHGGDIFFSPPHLEVVLAFLRRTIGA